MTSGNGNQLSANALVTDGYTRLEWARSIERKADQWRRCDSVRLDATQKLAKKYLKEPAADPTKTCLPKVEEPSLMLRHLQERLSDCLLLRDDDPMQSVQSSLSPEFLTKFNLTHTITLEQRDKQPLRLSCVSPIKYTPTAALQELALLLPLKCTIDVVFDAAMLNTAPPDFVHHFVVILGRFVQAVKYTDVIGLCSEFAEKSLNQILEGCGNLSKLDIVAPVVNISALRCACSKVTILSMQNNLALTDDDVKLLACGLVHLKEISFAGCQGLTDHGLSYFLSECPFLRRVDFSKTAVTGLFIPKFFAADKLTDLLLNDTPITDDGLRTITTRLPQLCVLELAGCKNISFEAVSVLVNRLLRASIDLRRCSQFTLDHRKALVKNNDFASLQFDGPEVEPKPIPSSEELLFVHFSLYLSSAFQDLQAIAHLREDRCLFIRLNPNKDAIDSLPGRQDLVYHHVEWLIRRYAVHLELCYHALTVSATMHPLGQFLTKIFPYVTSLDIISYPELEEELIPRKIVSSWPLPKLREMNLVSTTICDKEIANIQAPNLEALQFINQNPHREEFFTKLFTYFPKLQQFTLCDGIKVTQQMAIVYRWSSFLSLGKVASQFTSLDLGPCKDAPLDALDVVSARCPKLQKLTLRDGVDVMQQTVVVYKWSSFLSLGEVAAKFTSLDLRSCTDAPPDAIAVVSVQCPELVRLNSSGLSISEMSLQKARSNLKKLKELQIANTGVEDQHFVQLLDRQLTSLDLSHTKITGQGLAKIENLPLLTKLQLNGCKAVNDEVLSQLKYSCDLIQHLEISGCTKVTELSIWTLLRAWKQLEVIKCDGCAVSDAVLQYLKDPKSKAEQLTLDLNSLKGDYALAIILLWHPNLTSLDLRGRGSIDMIVNCCPRLKTLTLDAKDILGKLELPGVTVQFR